MVRGLSATGAGAATIIDIKKVNSLRKLEKEYSLLVKYRNAKNKQNYLLEMDTSLKVVLKNDLLIINGDEAQKKLENQNSKVPLMVNSKWTVLGNMGGITDTVNKGARVF
ncbi:MAG: hypothetical protein RCG15_00925 [Candidatus Rickettsia vulgarisii]